MKIVSPFLKIIAHILVTIHARLACAKNVSLFLMKNVLVRTVSKFVIRLNVLTITKSLASQWESNFLRNARHAWFKCQTCSANVERKRQDDHRCGERVCHICKEYVLSDHLCYMQPEPPKKPNDKLIFYDFQTDFSSGQHVVNFAVGQYSDGTEFVFKGYDALHQFCEFLFSIEHKGFTAIAHNAKGFDAVLIQRWLIQHRPTANMHVIHSGQKVMQLTLSDYQIRLTDSLNFLQMPLSKFPETFGLDLTTYSKGNFPFKFNIFENQNYIGPMPSIEFYATDTKKDRHGTNLLPGMTIWLRVTIFLTFKKKCTRTVHKM